MVPVAGDAAVGNSCGCTPGGRAAGAFGILLDGVCGAAVIPCPVAPGACGGTLGAGDSGGAAGMGTEFVPGVGSGAGSAPSGLRSTRIKRSLPASTPSSPMALKSGARTMCGMSAIRTSSLLCVRDFVPNR